MTNEFRIKESMINASVLKWSSIGTQGAQSQALQSADPAQPARVLQVRLQSCGTFCRCACVDDIDKQEHHTSLEVSVDPKVFRMHPISSYAHQRHTCDLKKQAQSSKDGFAGVEHVDPLANSWSTFPPRNVSDVGWAPDA